MFAFRPSNNNGSGGKPCDGDGGRIGLSERKKIALASEANSEREREGDSAATAAARLR